MKGATLDKTLARFLLVHFNPRAREGRDMEQGVKIAMQDNISIHAPVKGATTYTTNLERGWEISIHAPVKGATQCSKDFV